MCTVPSVFKCRTVRAISSDRGKVVSGSDDHSVLVWDKQTTQLLEELNGHDGPTTNQSCRSAVCARSQVNGVLTASHDGTVKMWDVRTDRCVATVGRCSSAVLCMEYDDNVGVLAAGGRDVVANIWDIRASRQMHKLSGHTQWIRSIRMVGDTVITGSDDWTARMWSVNRGTCDAVLACHAGPILCVEYSSLDRGVITGSTDGLLRFWENDDGGIRCAKNVTIHNAAILSVNAGEHWPGIEAADNSLSLFHRPQERLGGFSGAGPKMAGWQLYRTPQKTVAMVYSLFTSFAHIIPRIYVYILLFHEYGTILGINVARETNEELCALKANPVEVFEEGVVALLRSWSRDLVLFRLIAITWVSGIVGL
ncbi:hypothetical protein V8G54_028341 [Vigna mungo]|uniref:Uncharacterized protein n=1 Tax=Vigna mungo TaxID=3915 RepID=A0AAQ3RLL1_VIGMU